MRERRSIFAPTVHGNFFRFLFAARRWPREGVRLRKKEKAPSTFQSRTPRQPSPRTAKPRLDIKIRLIFCKRHFGNPTEGRMSRCLPQNEMIKQEGIIYFAFSIAFAKSTRRRWWSKLPKWRSTPCHAARPQNPAPQHRRSKPFRRPKGQLCSSDCPSRWSDTVGLPSRPPKLPDR